MTMFEGLSRHRANKPTIRITAPVVSAFPGTGKSSLFNSTTQFKYAMLDSDSSTFPKEGFPANYISHISRMLDQTKLLMVSSHLEVREAMFNAGIPYILVCPDAALKEEYLARYKDRGSPQAFVDLMDKSWDTFVQSCLTDSYAITVRILGSGQYLSDVIAPCCSWRLS